MNDWNHIPIECHSDSPPKARGRSCLRPAGPLASANLLGASGWMNWITNPRRCSLRSPSILLKCPFDLAIFCWQKESKCVNMITDDVFFFTCHLCPFKSRILWHESLRNAASFTKSSGTIDKCIFISRELRTRTLQGRRALLEGRDKIVIHRTSANEATQYTGNWAWTFRLVTRSSDHADYFPSRAKR